MFGRRTSSSYYDHDTDDKLINSIMISDEGDGDDISVSLNGGADEESTSEASSSNTSSAASKAMNNGKKNGRSSVYQSSQDTLKREMLRDEDANVKKSKISVIIVFLICASTVTYLVYRFAKQIDEQRFQVEYEGYIKDIQALVKWEVRYNFALMEQLR